jgi:hypothetical protein
MPRRLLWLLFLGASCASTSSPPRVSSVPPARSTGLARIVDRIAGLHAPLAGTSPFVAPSATHDAGTVLDLPISAIVSAASASMQRSDDGGDPTASQVPSMPAVPPPPPGDNDDTDPRCFLRLPGCDPRRFESGADGPTSSGYLGMAAALAMLACRPEENLCARDPQTCERAVARCLPRLIPNNRYACGVGTFGFKIRVNEEWIDAQIASERLDVEDASWLVLGIYAHEEGPVLYKALGREEAESQSTAIVLSIGAPETLSLRQREELFADGTAGCVMSRAPASGTRLLAKFIRGVQAIGANTEACVVDSAADHPCVCLRNQAIRLGWTRCANGRALPADLNLALSGCANQS